MPSKKPITRPARQNERMIEVRVRFWTNDIAPKKGEIRPKRAWTSGVVSMAKNESHGIAPQSPKPFRSPFDLLGVIEKVLIAHGVRLHRGRRAAKLIE